MRRSIVIVILALLLSSCGGTTAASTPTMNAQAVMTSVKLTVDANLANMAAQTPSATSTLVPTETSIPTATTTPTAIITPSITTIGTGTTSALKDKAQLVSQSVADNSKFNPGAPFSVTWTFKNVGTTTWTTDYTAKFWSDDLMGSSDTIHFSKAVKPDESIDITMNFKAPATIGSAKSSWWLQTATGVNYFPFFVLIEVISALPSPPTSTITMTPTITDTVQPSQTATTVPASSTPTITETP